MNLSNKKKCFILNRSIILFILFLSFFYGCKTEEKELAGEDSNQPYSSDRYSDLVDLFKEWRTFEKPPFVEGAPDYTKETFEKRWPGFQELRSKLKAIDTTGWSVANKVDWMVVWAEMNGYDFNHRVLKPWVRDPAFYKSVWTYKSDVPAHEGPTHHATTELWTYDFPLSPKERTRLLDDLKVIPILNEQAKLNLLGNAKDLWITGIRDIQNQSKVLQALKSQDMVKDDSQLVSIIDNAIMATDDFVAWLQSKSKSKTGPSGIGKENYTWYLQNVHLVPLTWDDEVMILKRELARAWTALKLEEYRNRDLPQLVAANSPEAYNKMADEAAKSLITFLD
ncbi:hypothetical protein HME9304_00120 [Flagellimonas maritima]|uniref:DUF885 family protein n=1 Tax=Flagellimonas maritima TaxID=1383885 RepID=A0A2Z4LMW0_9FLAO|nr:hypothetical protein [Allomuricauda aurantiaca]AWX43133.1 hypothetical protein HME9304_00120 [Allomuricauda aurantiaca]